MSNRYIQAALTEEEFQLVKIAALMKRKSVKEFAKEALLEKCKEVVADAN